MLWRWAKELFRSGGQTAPEVCGTHDQSCVPFPPGNADPPGVSFPGDESRSWSIEQVFRFPAAKSRSPSSLLLSSLELCDTQVYES